MISFIDLPNELIYKTIHFLSIPDKMNARETCKINNSLIRFMHIKIYLFNKKFNESIIPFRISTTITNYMSIGLITEWQSQFCWCKSNNIRQETIPKTIPKTIARAKKYIIKESINEIGFEFASIWLYNAILNWSIIENNR